MPLKSNMLFLPQLQKSPQPDFLHVKSAETVLSHNVSDAFSEIWKNGPQNTSNAELLRCMLVLIPEFGKLAKAGQGKVKVFEKETSYDWVTEVDQGIEMLLRLWIRKWYPDHKIIGEEGHKDLLEPGDPVWFIDPIDGTTNFVEGQQKVSMHIGLFKDGKPVLCFLGLPILDKLYYNDPDSNAVYCWDYCVSQNPVRVDKKEFALGLGTEYLDSRTDEHRVFGFLVETFKFSPIRVRSIGINILSFITGEMAFFYKPKVKLWDIMAPLGLVHCLYKEDLSFEMMYPDSTKTCDLFDWTDDMRELLNVRHRKSCRIGLCMVYPSHLRGIREAVVDQFRDANT